MISLLHYCHYKNVAKEDIPAYTRAMGIGLVVVAVGVWITGLLRIIGLPSLLSLSAAVLGIIIGVIIMSKAQMKYNGSWF